LQENRAGELTANGTSSTSLPSGQTELEVTLCHKSLHLWQRWAFLWVL